MYHTWEAADRCDKVYALLGMSSNYPGADSLFPDYAISWKALLQQVVKFVLSKQVSVMTWDDEEMAVIKSKGCVLGKVFSVESDLAWHD